jgi:hypothetical protein
LAHGEIELARVHFDESIRIKRKSGDGIGLAASLGGLALLNLNTWRFEDAKARLLEDLQLVQEQRDLVTEIRLHNWLGQIILYSDSNILEAIGEFQTSLRLSQTCVLPGYAPVSDTVFGHIGLGFAYAAANSARRAAEAEHSARQGIKSLIGVTAEFAATACEVLSGQIFVLEDNLPSASVRLKGALDHLLNLSPLDHCDYCIRVCRFLAQMGQRRMAATIATAARRNSLVSKDSVLHAHLALFGDDE